MSKPFRDLSGLTFGKLLVGPETYMVGFRYDCGYAYTKLRRLWHCDCRACGGVCWMLHDDLVAGKALHCPECAKRARQDKHGSSKSRLYETWLNMHRRCSDKRDPYYGGAGIRVCDRWNEFVAFVEDMGVPPSPRHTIDRIDPLGDYSKSNCRWATADEQANNKRNTRWLEYQGDCLSLSQLARKVGIKRETLRDRLLRRNEPVAVAVDNNVNRRHSR